MTANASSAKRERRRSPAALAATASLVLAAAASSSYLASSHEEDESSAARTRRSLRWMSLSRFSDPATKRAKAGGAKDDGAGRKKAGRIFLGYTPSEWEKTWLENVDRWAEEKSICERLVDPNGGQWLKLMRFMEATCTNYPMDGVSPWCKQDDGYRPIYYNRQNGRVRSRAPPDVEFEPVPRPIVPTKEYDDVFSKFTYLDEATGMTYDEYIEPLVSHLRHPLAECECAVPHERRQPQCDRGAVPDERFVGLVDYHLTAFRGFIIFPPPPAAAGSTNVRTTTLGGTPQAMLFDAGASTFGDGRGGPSLSMLTEVYKRHGIDFTAIHAFEGTTSPEDFYQTVPPEYQGRIHFNQAWIRSSPPGTPGMDEKELDPNGPFLPYVIRDEVGSPDDTYVAFKLDIDSQEVEKGTVDYLLDTDEGLDVLYRMDEFFWEHHVADNYLMREIWGGGLQAESGIKRGMPEYVTLGESYDLFLRMRKLGVRAHSWI